MAAGACIIVAKYECRRPFFVFFFWLGQFRSFGSQGKQRKICGTNAKNALFGRPIDRSSLPFLRWLKGKGGERRDWEWGECRRLFLSPSLPLSLDSYNPVENPDYDMHFVSLFSFLLLILVNCTHGLFAIGGHARGVCRCVWVCV